MMLCCVDHRHVAQSSITKYRLKIYKGVNAWITPSTLFIVCIQILGYLIQCLLDNEYVEYVWATSASPFEIWRYVTYACIHGSLYHLVSNISLTLILAPTLEFVQGSTTVAVVWTLGVILGGLAHVMLDSVAVVGSSAGVYALLVSRIVDVLVNTEYMRTATLRLLTLICLGAPGFVDWLTTDALTTTSHAAHVGGAIGGLVASIICVQSVDGHFMLYRLSPMCSRPCTSSCSR